MVKYDRENKSLEEFEQTVREIMDIHDAGYDDSFEDSIEYVTSDALSDLLSDEQSSERSSNSSTVEEILFVSPKTACESKPDMVDDSEDFPAGNCDSEASVMASQLNHLYIADCAEYRGTGNIIDPGRRKKKTKKRCRNLDD